MLLVFKVAPYERPLVREALSQPVYDIIAEVEVLGIVERKAFKRSVFVEYFTAKLLIYAHISILLPGKGCCQAKASFLTYAGS